MNDAFDVWMSREDVVKSFFISGVEIVEHRSFVAYQPNPIQDFLGGIEEVIDDNYIVANLEERERCEAANVSCPSNKISMVS